jgi:hypothetical protein
LSVTHVVLHGARRRDHCWASCAIILQVGCTTSSGIGIGHNVLDVHVLHSCRQARAMPHMAVLLHVVGVLLGHRSGRQGPATMAVLLRVVGLLLGHRSGRQGPATMAVLLRVVGLLLGRRSGREGPATMAVLLRAVPAAGPPQSARRGASE